MGCAGRRSPASVSAVAGAIAIVIVLAVVFPVLVVMSGAVAAAILGQSLTTDAAARNEGSELVELNV